MSPDAKNLHHEAIIGKLQRELELSRQQIRESIKQIKNVETAFASKLQRVEGDLAAAELVRAEYVRRRKAANRRLKRAQCRQSSCHKRLRALRDALAHR